jgi:hypothetical protein
VWAAPSSTTLGNRAFGATGTPPPEGWSFAAFIVACGTARYRVKWNREGGFEQGDITQTQCQNITPFVDNYNKASTGGATNAVGDDGLFTVEHPGGNGDSKLVFTITTSSGCTILNGDNAGLAFEAAQCASGGAVKNGGLTIEFDLDSVFPAP